MKTKPVGVRADLYTILAAEAAERKVSVSLVLTEKLDQVLNGIEPAPQTGKPSGEKTQGGTKDVPNEVEQVMGMNLL